MSLKKLLFFVFILFSLFIFADGAENADVQSPPAAAESADVQSPPAAAESAHTQSPSGNENQNLSENEKEPEELDKGFYSIQSSGLTACFEDRWFFEKLDDDGRPLMSVLYEKDKLIEKKTYTYKDGYPESCEVVLSDKLVKIKYNKKRMETEKIIYDVEGKNELEKNIYTYDENNLLIESFLKKDGIEYISKFEYGPENKKKSKTDFVNGNKISYTEYMADKKIVHLFEYGKEIGVVEEET